MVTVVELDDRIVPRKALGRGGMGEVYLIDIEQFGGPVALKTVGPLCGDLARAELGLKIEAETIWQLKHPGIIGFKGLARWKGFLALAYEYVDGIDLREWLRRSVYSGDGQPGDDGPARDEGGAAGGPAPGAEGAGDLPPAAARLIRTREYIDRCCQLAQQAAEALGHAHARGVVHRDISPENLVIDEEGRLRIIDFGLARYLEACPLSTTRAILGTPNYLSPEHLDGLSKTDQRSDVFSLGIVLYECLTLRLPYGHCGLGTLVKKVVILPMPPLRRLNPAVPRDLESIVHKAISKDPRGRYADGAEFASYLARYLNRERVSLPPYRGRPERGEISAQRPVRVTFASRVLYAVSGIFALTATAGVFLPAPPAVGPVFYRLTLAILLAIALVSRALGWGLLRAVRAAMILTPTAATAVMLFAAWLFFNSFGANQANNPQIGFIRTLFSSISAGCILVNACILTPATWRWAAWAWGHRDDPAPPADAQRRGHSPIRPRQ